jgi:hypothetical protein
MATNIIFKYFIDKRFVLELINGIRHDDNRGHDHDSDAHGIQPSSL